jgi:hypothetical protein
MITYLQSDKKKKFGERRLEQSKVLTTPQNNKIFFFIYLFV